MKSNRAGSIPLVIVCSFLIPAAAANTPTAATAADSNNVATAGEPKLLADIRGFEVKVLGQASPTESIDKRLGALEVKLFGQQSTGSLLERIENIRHKVDQKNNSKDDSTSAVPAKEDKDGTKPTSAASTPASNSSTTPASSSQTKSEQLQKIQSAFESNDFKLARKLANDFVDEHPFDHNGYYALGQIDIQEKPSLPEYDQYSYNQFLKAYYLSPRNKLCEFAFSYIKDMENNQRHNDPKCVVTASYVPASPQALLNVGVNCFKRDGEKEAVDLFKFATKFPACATSGYYNLGAIAEFHGQLAAAMKQYESAETAFQKRAQILRDRLMQPSEMDQLSERLIARTLQRLKIKIKSGDKKWQGLVPTKFAPATRRCTINRLGDDESSDVLDAGAPFEQ